jgi:hypothetical protein
VGSPEAGTGEPVERNHAREIRGDVMTRHEKAMEIVPGMTEKEFIIGHCPADVFGDEYPMFMDALCIENACCADCWNKEYEEEEKMNEPIYASDLMSEARKNPEKYKGKRYRVIDAKAMWFGDFFNVVEVVKDEFTTTATIVGVKDGETTSKVVSFNSRARLEEIKPEPKPVPYREALEAHFKKHTIKCILNGKEHIYEYHYGRLKDDKGNAITSNQIINGVWYIVD